MCCSCLFNSNIRLVSRYAGQFSLFTKVQISLNLSNKTLKDVFKEIEQNSEFVIFYYEGVIDANKRVEINVKKQTVDKILDELFEGTDNAYNIVDKQIYITKKMEKLKKTILASAITQQQKKITGKVIDEMGEALLGVAIQVKGTPREVLLLTSMVLSPSMSVVTIY